MSQVSKDGARRSWLDQGEDFVRTAIAFTVPMLCLIAIVNFIEALVYLNTFTLWVLCALKACGSLAFYGLVLYFLKAWRGFHPEVDWDGAKDFGKGADWWMDRHEGLTFVLIVIAVVCAFNIATDFAPLPYHAYSVAPKGEDTVYRARVVSARKLVGESDEVNLSYSSYLFWQLAAADGYNTEDLIEAKTSSSRLLYFEVPILAFGQSMLILLMTVSAALITLLSIGVWASLWCRSRV